MSESFKDLAVEYVMKSKSMDTKAIVYALLAIVNLLEELAEK